MKKSPYLAFTSLMYRIIQVVTLLFFIGIGFLADIYIGSAGIVVISAGAPLITVFTDYFAFSGTSTRKVKSMQFVKSSFKGLDFFKNALKTDLLLKHLCLIFSYLGYILAEIIYFIDSETLISSLLILLIYLPISQLTMNVTLIISRRISLTLAVQIAICYICSMISTVFLLMYSFLLPENMSDYTMPSIISFAVIEILSTIAAVILYKDCVKGYVSSFSDT